MLIEFSVGNYKSFKDTVTFSMVSANIVAKDKALDENNVFRVDDDLALLKSAAIYGANASGKSNLTTAIRFMRRFVLSSSKDTQVSDTIDVEQFRLSAKTEGEPSFFEAVFLLEGKKYRYGFEVDSQRVVSEWLFYVPVTKEARLFKRDSENITVSNAFKEGRGIEDKTRVNALFLSVVAQFNGTIAQKILNWFRGINVISGLRDLGYRGYTVRNFENEKYKNDILRLVRQLDLGIEDIQIEKANLTAESLPQNTPEELRKLILNAVSSEQAIVKTIHRKFGDEGKQISLEVFNLDEHESEGTKKLFALAGPLLDTLRRGSVLVIDEMDARLHPLITCAIIALFNSRESNPHNAQLVFTTQDTNLLSKDIFRRDQIWFTEKDKEGATYLYSLAEYKVRNDASFESDYIQGKYGAIPFIGDLGRLSGDSDA